MQYLFAFIHSIQIFETEGMKEVTNNLATGNLSSYFALQVKHCDGLLTLRNALEVEFCHYCVANCDRMIPSE